MSPKQKLQTRPDFKDFASLLSDPRLEHCCEVAMLSFVDNTARASDASSAMAAHYEVEGGKRFLRTLRGLAAVTPEPKSVTSGQLKHDIS